MASVEPRSDRRSACQTTEGLRETKGVEGWGSLWDPVVRTGLDNTQREQVTMGCDQEEQCLMFSTSGGQSFIFINEVLLEHGHAHSLTDPQWH